eukprot:COSAG02_NODE_458_length_21942_cov_1643.812068_22_plen_76_part_00
MDLVDSVIMSPIYMYPNTCTPAFRNRLGTIANERVSRGARTELKRILGQTVTALANVEIGKKEGPFLHYRAHGEF